MIDKKVGRGYKMRLKIKNLVRAFDQLTSLEFSLYIHIAQRVDLRGLIQDLTMADTKQVIGCSKQGFYDALYSLEKKKFLSISYSKNVDFDILLTDNYFKNEKDTFDPYINLNFAFINTRKFHELNVSIKKFILRIMSFKGKRRLSKDTLKTYKVLYLLDDLKEFFDIKILDNNIFIFSMTYQFIKNYGNIFFQHIRHKIKTFAKKNRLTYEPKELKDTINVIYNNREFVTFYNYALNELVRQGKEKLEPKLINHIITNHKRKLQLT